MEEVLRRKSGAPPKRFRQSPTRRTGGARATPKNQIFDCPWDHRFSQRGTPLMTDERPSVFSHCQTGVFLRHKPARAHLVSGPLSLTLSNFADPTTIISSPILDTTGYSVYRSKALTERFRSVTYSLKNFFFSNEFADNLGENIILQENFKMLTRDVGEKIFLKNYI
jgi:hypothetical protein